MPDQSGRVPSHGVRKQQPCICPWGWSNSRDYGRQRARLSTTSGCLEHDSCHRWTPENVAIRQAAMKTDIHPWCPIHEAKGCPLDVSPPASPTTPA